MHNYNVPKYLLNTCLVNNGLFNMKQFIHSAIVDTTACVNMHICPRVCPEIFMLANVICFKWCTEGNKFHCPLPMY